MPDWAQAKKPLAKTGAALAAVAGMLAASPAASASPVPGMAAVATSAAGAAAPTWRMQAPPEPAKASAQAFDTVSCSSSSACLALATQNYDAHGYQQFAETWNGSHWSVRTVPDAANIYLYGVSCRSAQWCDAVGASGDSPGPSVDHWNGGGWSPVKVPWPASSTINALTSVACSGTRACTAVGDSGKGPGTPGLLAERWNASGWNVQAIPAPSAGNAVLGAVACPAAKACRVVGSDKGGLFSEVWNGSSWKIRPVPVPSGGSAATLSGVSCSAADSCEAVGSYYTKGGSTALPLAEVWNGANWRAQAPSAAGAVPAKLFAVSCVSATDCEAAGEAGPLAGIQAGLLEKWNGTAWSVQKTVPAVGNRSASLTGISCTTGPVCEAVGAYAGEYLLALRYSA